MAPHLSCTARRKRFRLHEVLSEWSRVRSSSLHQWTGGKTLQLGGGGRTENVEMTSFYIWDRMLSESEIDKEANKCRGGMGGPVVRW